MYEKMNGKDKPQLTGLIVVETDDLLGGGTGPKFHDAVEQLRKRYTFGKWKVLMDEPTEYGGRTLRQSKDFGFTISMSRYLRGKADPIRIERGRGKDQEADATPQEVTQMRGVVGKISWTAREGAPQGAGDASLLAGTFPHPKVKDLTAANAALRRLIENDVPIKIRPIPLERLVLLSFADSSLNNAGQGKAQLSNIACAADKSIHEGAEAEISILAYRSHKNPKAGGSTLLNEAHAFSTSLADGEWIASWLGLAKSLDYDLRERNTLNREIKIVNIMSKKDCSTETTTVTDAKSLYDAVNQPQYTGAEKRAALEICVIKDSLDSLGGQAKWVPHELNPADCLTKLAGNAAPLLELMRRSTYKVVAEEDELEKRKQYRENTGKKNPRPNRTTETCRAPAVNHTVSTQQAFMCLLDSIGSKPQRFDSRVENYIGIVDRAPEMANKQPTTPPNAVRFNAVPPQPTTPPNAVLFNASLRSDATAYDEWGVQWFIDRNLLQNLDGIKVGKLLRTMGKNNSKICRAWDDTYPNPNGKNTAKIPPATTFGPIQELRTVLIGEKMYISAKVPPIEALGSEFAYVNVAYYDTDDKKFTETAKVVPEPPPPPPEGVWSNWQVNTSQDARDYPASRLGPGGAASSYYEWKPKAAVKPEPAVESSAAPETTAALRHDWSGPVTKGLQQRIPDSVLQQAPMSPLHRRWRHKSESSQAEVVREAKPDSSIQAATLPKEDWQPMIEENAASMQARAANLVPGQAQTQQRVEMLKQMLDHYPADDLDLHTEEEVSITFANLLRELQVTIFELDSNGRTIKQYLGEKEAQDKETTELVGNNRVPRGVYTYLRFLAAREIQRKRNSLFTQSAPSPSIKHWTRKLRDDTRRRVRSYTLGQSSAFERKTEEQSSLPVVPTGAMQKKKAAALERGVNLNKISQQRKRQRQASGSSSKKPVASPCDQARELIAQFEKLVIENAKYGDLVKTIAEAPFDAHLLMSLEPTPTEEMSETDVINIVQKGQNEHGLMHMPEGPQPGNTPSDFTANEARIESETPDTGCPKFEYDHWQTACLNSNGNKTGYSQAFSAWPTAAYIDAASQAPNPERVQQAMWSFGIGVKPKDLILSTDDGPAKTPGTYYYVDFENLSAPQSDARVPRLRDPRMMHMSPSGKLQTATHGTSFGAAKEIIAAGCFTEALNKTESKCGVYCEGTHRRQNTASYSTLNFSREEDSDDLTLYSAFFELAVNREVGTSTHKQWVQPPDSIIIAGMYIHCLPVTKLYTSGFIGWWTVAPSVFDSIRIHKFLRDRQEKTETVVPRFGQRRTASQPPLKIARTEEIAQDDDSTSVSSSSPDVAGTAEGLEKISLEHGPVTILPRPLVILDTGACRNVAGQGYVAAATAAFNPLEWTCKSCKHVMKDGNQNWKQCAKCGQWRTDEFEPTKYWPKYLDEAD